MTDLKICRICLRTEAKVYRLDQFQLVYYYEEVMALKLDYDDGLPQYCCYECATMLHKFHKFKEKCYRGQKAFKEMLWKGPVTYESVYKVDRKALGLQSTLVVLPVEYVTSDDMDTFIKEEQDEYDEDNCNESLSDTDNQEIFNDESNSIDEKCIVLPDNEVDMAVDSENPLDSTTVFVEDKKEVTVLENEPLKNEKKPVKKSKRSHTAPITRNAKKYKIVSKTKFLDANHWKMFNLSEEEAVKDFRAKADDPKYLAASFKCTDCFKGFSKELMLKRHRHLRHNETVGPMECRFCRMRFKWDCELRKHMRSHFTKFQCLRCDLVCPIETTALLHEDYHNGIIRKCIHCNEEFRHSSTYYTHLRTHRSEHVCTTCGASFVSVAGLSQHKKLQHFHSEIESPDDDEEVNTFCEKCNIRFETRKAYNEHLFHSAMHLEGAEQDLNDEYSVPKKILGKKAQEKVSSKNSEQKLPSIKSYRKRKPRRQPKKPTDCHQCGKHFETQAACMKHHLAEHPRTSFFAPNERHICEICGASLAPGSVAMHQNIHTREKEFPCDSCSRTFHSSIGLKRHMVTHTGEKPFACSLCDKRFTQSNSMKLHYRTLHLKQPYPKRNRRKKKAEPPMVMEEEKSTGDDSNSGQQDMHYLTLQ
ncbi:zinc finger protein 93-like [Ostrinia nubilalis]|uniref:zinc finger protein 93-like n=1 Tax=Ostrinia nubilalis TaxID=29057 RepID=UPI0030823001